MIAQDIASGPMWKEYISFLQAPKPGSETFSAIFPQVVTGQEESARFVALRYGGAKGQHFVEVTNSVEMGKMSYDSRPYEQ